MKEYEIVESVMYNNAVELIERALENGRHDILDFVNVVLNLVHDAESGRFGGAEYRREFRTNGVKITVTYET